MDKWNLLIIIVAAIVSILIAYSNTSYVNEESILGFLMMAPTLIGILLASILTSLAIVFAVMGNSEMVRIRELENKQKKEFFQTITNNLKQNVYFIFAAFIITTLSCVFYIDDSYFICSHSQAIFFEVYRSLFVLVFVLFVISCIATYDIINALFNIFEFKHDLLNHEK
jgi:hypothetical protein